MSDVAAGLSPEQIADLCALADGTLPAERRAEVEARVAASPELQALVERQRQAVAAMQALTAEEVPVSLRAAVEARGRPDGARRGRTRTLVPRLAVAGAAAVVASVLAAVLLTGGPGAPTVADAARLAGQAPTAPAPRAVGKGQTRLAVGVEGVPFPNFALWAGWRTLGVRRERVDGRDATVVFYGKDGRRLGYVIVGGKPLDRPTGTQARYIRTVRYQTLRSNGRLGVTWLRGGHTCILVGEAPIAELLRLASWPLTPPR